MRKPIETLVNGAVVLLVAVLAALLMRFVTPGGGLLGVALWAVFFVSLMYFPPQECVAKVRRHWRRG